MSLQSLLIDRCEISRYKDGPTKRGNFENKQVPEPIAQDVHCRATLKSTTNTNSQGRTVAVSYYILRLPKDTDIQNGDVVKLNGSVEEWKVGEPFSPSRHHVKVELKREEEV